MYPNRIREWRELRQMSFAQVAAACSPPASRATIFRLEHGRMRFTPQWQERLAAVFGCAPSDLLSEYAMTAKDQILELLPQLTPDERSALLAQLLALSDGGAAIPLAPPTGDGWERFCDIALTGTLHVRWPRK